MRDKLHDLIFEGMVKFVEACELSVHVDAEAFADYLIANGVTLQRWIPVSERLPRCGERVLITEGHAVFEAYLSMSNIWVRHGIGWVEEVTHWMPMPEPPKEGE